MQIDFQKFIETLNEINAKERGRYHLTYGELIKALKKAPSDAVFDKRIKGIGSWRGSYTEIALFTESEGFYAVKEDFNDWGGKDFEKKYERWKKENVVSGKLPRNAHKLAELLESLLGLKFIGYKGGAFTIEEWKPLWLEKDESTYNEIAIVGIDENLRLITKDLKEE